MVSTPTLAVNHRLPPSHADECLTEQLLHGAQKFSWCLGPIFSSCFLCAGRTFAPDGCDLADELDDRDPMSIQVCEFARGYLTITGAAMLGGHLIMTYQRFSGARLASTPSLVACTGGQLLYLLLVINWHVAMVTDAGSEPFPTSSFFAKMGVAAVATVVLIRAYFAISYGKSAGGSLCPFNKQAFETAFSGTTTLPPVRSLCHPACLRPSSSHPGTAQSAFGYIDED